MSFIKFYTDFTSAKISDNPPVSTIFGNPCIQLLPNDTMFQITDDSLNINFAGAIQVDFIGCDGSVLQNIDNYFFYNGFQDRNGIYQIAFEFGATGTDYYNKPIYLRITDLVNGLEFFSNEFKVTNVRSHLSTKFIYFDQNYFRGTSYDLMPYKQSVRFADFFYNNPENLEEFKQFTTSKGYYVDYRNITTYLRKYLFQKLDFFTNERLNYLFSHPFVYLALQRVSVSEFKTNERPGDTNWLTSEILVNPKNEFIVDELQLFPRLSAILNPVDGALLTTFNGMFTMTFNRAVTITPGSVAKVYKDGVLIGTFALSVIGNVVSFNGSAFTYIAGDYSVIIMNNAINGYSLYQWLFTVGTGEFLNTEFTNEFFIN